MSPSQVIVHHAVPDRYVGRNCGGMLVVWDRLFGSFREEDERCVYGTRSPLDSRDPLWSNAQVYWGLASNAGPAVQPAVGSGGVGRERSLGTATR